VVVTAILFVTGSFSSVFSFLYLVIIIYSSILLPIRGTIIIAALCSIQFGIMVDLEYYGVIYPLGKNDSLLASVYPGSQVFYKILITMIACFAVSFLSSFLSEQVRKTRKELQTMEDHVKRVEKMASIGEMAAGMAHEIKNPLASLTGSIQLLSEEIHYNPDHDRLMRIILREADRLSSLVNNFLLYARPPVGRVEAVELDKILTDTVDLLKKDTITDGRITIARKIESASWVSIDPVHLRQIFWNLLLNAAEAITGKGAIDIETYTSKSRQVFVRIADEGCGMTREELKSIFDPFFTTKPTGTGLGLSIVHRILEAYDAWLNVDSEPGKGTAITLQFKQIDPPLTACQLELDSPV
jgi:two-component system sensor histidine kinase PilS (NtrC family)